MLTFTMRSIIFYKTPSGQCPVKEFLTSLPEKERQKVTWVLTLVRDVRMVPKEYFKKLQNTDESGRCAPHMEAMPSGC